MEFPENGDGLRRGSVGAVPGLTAAIYQPFRRAPPNSEGNESLGELFHREPG